MESARRFIYELLQVLIRFAGDLSSGAIAGICVGVVVFLVVLTVVIYLIVRSQNKTTSSRVHVRTT